jgi:glycosyltransferase involved in cell wall biosynthesis
VRILMISDVYFPRVNGVSTSIQTFWRELDARGHHVTLIAPDYGQAPDDPKLDLIRIPSRYLPLDPEDRLMKARAIRALTERLRGRSYDLVHIQTPFVAHYLGVALARDLRVPRIESYHTFFEEYLHHYAPFLPASWTRGAARRFSRSQCNDVDAVVVPSTAMAEVLRRYGISTPMHIIPTGIDLARFQNADGRRFRTHHDIAAARRILLYVGRVAHEKNIDMLLRAFAHVRIAVPEALLVVAGEGPAERHLHHLAHQLGIDQDVLFVGYLARDRALLDCYAAADAFVFASRTETQGLVLLEAMALGVPVVSTAVMGTHDILAPRRGALLAEEDVGDLADKAVTILRNPALRERLAQDGREYVREWSAAAMAERMIALYASLVPQAQRRLAN